MQKYNIRKWELSLALAFLFTCIASVAGFAVSCAQVRGEVLRLHVLANSDSPEDQALKLRVRDAVLMAGSALFDGSATVDSAREKLEKDLDKLQIAAKQEILRSGYAYPVSIRMTEEYFATRVYQEEGEKSVTLPAGLYYAIKVVIGEGAGQNWWCVMFPPLCLPAAQNREQAEAYFGGEKRIVEQTPEFEPRFKLVEWYEKLRSAVD